MKLARVQMTLDVLESVLQLPAGVRIRRVFPPDYRVYEQAYLELVLDGEALPVGEIHEGDPIPEILCEATCVDGETVPKYYLTFKAY